MNTEGLKARAPAFQPRSIGDVAQAAVSVERIPQEARNLGTILNDTSCAVEKLQAVILDLEKRLDPILLACEPQNLVPITPADIMCTPATELAASNERQVRAAANQLRDILNRIAL